MLSAMASEDPDRAAAAAEEAAALGLCADCRFHVRQSTRRGSVFHRCRRADEDERYLRYPPLPVRRCAGHEPGEGEDASGAA